ncbi:MAG: hypothetical protein Q4G03_00095 [Planctomycetia bacterium]|nr:hypothetical protein [Planctomycetia bacterium]
MTKLQTPTIRSEHKVSTANTTALFETTYTQLSERKTYSDRSKTFERLLVTPVHYESNYAYPLIVWLHDSGKTEREILNVMPCISDRNYIAVAPRGFQRKERRVIRSFVNGRMIEQKSWLDTIYDWEETEKNISEAENLVFDSITEASNKYNVHNRRVFLAGRGTGGTMALHVALRNPREFAGVVSIDARFPCLERQILRQWDLARDLPMLITTGSHNSTRAPRLSVEELQLLHTAGMTALVRQYNDNFRSPLILEERMNRLLTDVNRWVLERALNPQSTSSEFFA